MKNCLYERRSFALAKDNMTKISFRINTEEKEALMKFAEENDLTVSQIIRRAVKLFLEQSKDE